MADLPAVAGGKPVRDRFLIFGCPLFGPEEEQEVLETIRSGWIGTGPRAARFEAALQEYLGCGYAVTVNSCTAALHLSLLALGLKEEDEVITTPMTFAATSNVILQVGARPVFADVRRDTLNIDPAEIARRIGPRTKVLLPVHFAGQPCEMSDILALAREHGLRILEDAAHAIGAEYRGTKVGKVGDLTAFSFYPNKNITTGEGGAVCTERAEWAEFIQIGRLHGLSRDAWKRYSSRRLVTSEVVFPGYKYNLTDLQAALGIHQLAKIERFAEIRRRLVQRYDESLRGEDPLSLPARIEGIRHAEHLYPVLLRLEQLTIDRNAVVEAMLAENVGVGIHYVAVHLHPYYQEHLGFRRGDFPNAEWVSDRVFSLPISPGMTESDVDDVVFALRRILRYYRR